MKQNTYYRAATFLLHVNHNLDRYPLWYLRRQVISEGAYVSLTWKGPGSRRVSWTPHAIERLIERTNLGVEDDHACIEIAKALQMLTYHVLCYGGNRKVESHRVNVSLPQREEEYMPLRDCGGDRVVIVVQVLEGEDLIKTVYFNNAEDHPYSRTMHFLPEALSAFSVPIQEVFPPNFEYWSADRQNKYKEMVARENPFFEKYKHRLWFLEMTYLTRDFDFTKSLLMHMIVPVKRRLVLSYLEDVFKEDGGGTRTIAFRFARHTWEGKIGGDMSESLECIVADFQGLPEDIRKGYVSLTAMMKTHQGITLQEIVAVKAERHSTPFSKEILAIREAVKDHGVPTVSKHLEVSRSVLRAWMWGETNIPNEALDRVKWLVSAAIPA